MNIEEDYVSYEIAKLLKEKGFSEDTEHEMWYVIKQFSTGCHWNSCTYKVGDITREYEDKCCISMPTIQMVIKWLEKKKHVAIIPVLSSILDDEKFLWDVEIVIAETGEKYSQGWVYEDRKSAYEAAIKYYLENLI